ncbi:hypothetical protein JCM33374_g1029 [Metschnikowia sp. JCM 33374]|nr:hypothetical protein JCM33374_g1029 [Metschnikowia sp. JCM 33374]
MARGQRNAPQLRGPSQKRSRNFILPGRASKLIEHYSKNPHLSQKQLQDWYKAQFGMAISQPAVSRLVSGKHPIVKLSELGTLGLKGRPADYPEFEEKLYLRLRAMDNVHLRVKVVKNEALALFTQMYPEKQPLKFSNGWYEGFQKRFHLNERRFDEHTTGPQDSTPEDPNPEDPNPEDPHPEDPQCRLNEFRKELTSKLNSFSPSDVYYMGETALFWDQLPDRDGATHYQHRSRKTSLIFSIVFCTNVTGCDKTKLSFIGKAASYKSFGKNNENLSYLDCEWRYNPTAQKNSRDITEWLLAFSRHVASLGKTTVLLLMANHSSHRKALNLLQAKGGFSRVQVVFVPENTPSVLHTLDRGIIGSLKCKYAEYLLEDAIEKNRSVPPKAKSPKFPKLPMVKAIKWIVFAWKNTPPRTIFNCWQHMCYCELLQRAEPEEGVDAVRKPVENSCVSASPNSALSYTYDSSLTKVEEANGPRRIDYLIYSLHHMGVIQNPMSAAEFLDAMEIHPPAENVSDNRSLRDESNDDIEHRPEVSHLEVISALGVVLKYVRSYEWDKSLLLYPQMMLNRAKQRHASHTIDSQSEYYQDDDVQGLRFSPCCIVPGRENQEIFDSIQ